MIWTPGDIPTLRAWFEADHGALNPDGDPCTNGDPVATLTNRAPSYADMLQATSASRPIWLAAGHAGHPGIQFDGSDDFLKSTDAMPAQPAAVYVVAKLTGGALDPTIVDGPANSARIFDDQSTGGRVRLYAGSYGPAVGIAPVGTMALYEAIFNGASSSLAYNAGTPASGNPGTGNGGSMTLGQWGNPPAAFGAAAMIFLAIVACSDITTITRRRIQAYYARKYGLFTAPADTVLGDAVGDVYTPAQAAAAVPVGTGPASALSLG